MNKEEKKDKEKEIEEEKEISEKSEDPEEILKENYNEKKLNSLNLEELIDNLIKNIFLGEYNEEDIENI